MASSYNPAAPGLVPRFARLFLACSDLITTYSAPVPDLLNSLFRARSGPQPAGCQASNAMRSQDFLDRSADSGQKNSLLAGKPDCRQRTESEMILGRIGGGRRESL